MATVAALPEQEPIFGKNGLGLGVPSVFLEVLTAGGVYRKSDYSGLIHATHPKAKQASYPGVKYAK